MAQAHSDRGEDPDKDGPIRGRIRGAHLRRVCHGLGLRQVEGLSAGEERRRDLAAYLALAPASAVLTSVTAAEIMGWQLPKVPQPAPVHIAVGLLDRRPRRQGMICHRVKRIRQRVLRGGLPIDEPEEVLLAASRDVGRLDLLIMVESAKHCGDLDERRMTELLASGRPGVRNLRWAWLRVCPEAESAGETLLYEFHRCLEVPFEPQVELHDDTGRFLGRADLRVVATGDIHEYDGAQHRGRQQHRADLRRERGLAEASYRRRGYTLDDLLNHAPVVMHEIDRSLNRPHVPRRLEAWRTLVEDSLYSDVGRARVMHRWRRAGGTGGPPLAPAA